MARNTENRGIAFSRLAEKADKVRSVKVSWQPRLMGALTSGSPVGAKQTAIVMLSQEEYEATGYPNRNQYAEIAVRRAFGWRGFVNVEKMGL